MISIVGVELFSEAAISDTFHRRMLRVLRVVRDSPIDESEC